MSKDGIQYPLSVEGAPATLLGMQIGPFTLEEQIGRGGFGAVYRGRHALGGDVAIKVLHWHQQDNPERLQRFQREADTLARLDHANIVKLHHFGEIDRVGLYLVMEYLSGVSLKELILQQYPLSVERLKAIFWQLCDVLSYAHRHGVYHRDLKPQNVLIEEVEGREQVKLIDFGIASVHDQTQLTQTGSMLGSPAYLAPEQARGLKGPDQARADIYSLGVMAIQALTQKLPFSAANLTGFITHHLFTPAPKLSELRPEFSGWSPELEACLQRALAKDPAHRFGDALEFWQHFSRGLDLQGELKLQPLAREELLPSGPGSFPGAGPDAREMQTFAHSQVDMDAELFAMDSYDATELFRDLGGSDEYDKTRVSTTGPAFSPVDLAPFKPTQPEPWWRRRWRSLKDSGNLPLVLVIGLGVLLGIMGFMMLFSSPGPRPSDGDKLPPAPPVIQSQR